MENSERKLKLIIADDHEVVREGVKKLLSPDKNIEIIGIADNGALAVNLATQHRPDIVLLDILMPKMDGIQSTELIKKAEPDIKVVIFTAYEDSAHLDKALRAGADGYLSKEAGARDLISSLWQVMDGNRVFSQSVLHLLEKKFIAYENADTSPVALTEREQEVLNMVAKGKTSAEISEHLFISQRTVEAHRSNVIRKLGLKNSAALVRYAVLKYDKSGHSETGFSKKI